MSEHKSYAEYFEEMARERDAAIKRLLDDLDKERDKCDAIMYRKFGQYQKAVITELFNNAVTEFYNAYTPDTHKPFIYKRRGDVGSQTGGLYDILKMRSASNGTVDYDTVDDLLDPSGMHTDRKGGDLYEKVFVQGWHGGAESGPDHPDEGTPYYRRPPGWATWGHEAAQSTPAYDIFKRSIEFDEGPGGRIYEKFFSMCDEYEEMAVKNVMDRFEWK